MGVCLCYLNIPLITRTYSPQVFSWISHRQRNGEGVVLILKIHIKLALIKGVRKTGLDSFYGIKPQKT